MIKVLTFILTTYFFFDFRAQNHQISCIKGLTEELVPENHKKLQLSR